MVEDVVVEVVAVTVFFIVLAKTFLVLLCYKFKSKGHFVYWLAFPTVKVT